ncbi:hypothetical protein CEXT_23561 [Caerostris extrusa]|uniref:Uncharacterized protein n=1 Tax=Caerostris extrusa TaxID=172846 RepID=A0AAV4P743_CAEEX|nr:hypothetical protein CEXT_23561 [Caerostris extrusa]
MIKSMQAKSTHAPSRISLDTTVSAEEEPGIRGALFVEGGPLSDNGRMHNGQTTVVISAHYCSLPAKKTKLAAPGLSGKARPFSPRGALPWGRNRICWAQVFDTHSTPSRCLFRWTLIGQ